MTTGTVWRRWLPHCVVPPDKALLARLRALSPQGVAAQRREVVSALVERGWTYQEIAEQVGVTKAAVGNWMRR